MNGTVLPFRVPPSHREVLAKVRNAARNSDNVYWTRHALDRMNGREITSRQALRTMREGAIADKIGFAGQDEWKVTLKKRDAGRTIHVVVAVCGGGDLTVITVYRRGQRHGPRREMTKKTHHYRECGLHYIYLLNGFTCKETKHGTTVSIQDMDGLHRAIGTHLAKEKRALTGAELRFFRIELGLSQPRLGVLLGKTGQTVARWEKGQSRVDATADRVVRLLYTEQTGGNADIRSALQDLAALDGLAEDEVCFEDTDEGWRLRGAA